MNRLRHAACPALALAFLAGCLMDGGGGRARLPEGSYSVGSRFDADYMYVQYFTVLPEGRWDWVEYGSNAAKVELCKVTRRTGTYALEDSALVVTVEAEAAPVVKCGFSRRDFEALVLSPKKAGDPGKYPIRNLTDTSFEAEDFLGREGWRAYAREKDPFGFR